MDEEIGVVGIKVDFFGGDKQETMKLYEDILSDANDYGLEVIFMVAPCLAVGNVCTLTMFPVRQPWLQRMFTLLIIMQKGSFRNDNASFLP